MSVKTDFIQDFRATPEGIATFLETEIPTLAAISTPVDVDAAIIAQGVLAMNLNLILKAFEGLTPIELILRIGQHNSVLESAMLAGLEYLEGDTENAQTDFEILEPSAGTTYLPGNVRFNVRVNNGHIVQMAVEIGELAPIALDSDDGNAFYGYAHIEDVGSYTATVTALFDNDATQTGTVSFVLATSTEPPTPEPAAPDGEDLWTLEIDLDHFHVAVRGIGETTMSADGLSVSIDKDILDTIAAAADKVVDTGGRILEKIGSAAVEAASRVATAIDAIFSGSRSVQSRALIAYQAEMLLMVGDLVSAVDSYSSYVISKYWELNQHPAGGYTSSPEVLRGAAAAMNDRYGPGSVVY